MVSPAEPVELHSAEEIRERVAELAARISRDYADADDLCIVGVLKGAFIFLADLARLLTVPHRLDFIALSSYGDRGAEQGPLRLRLDLREDVSGAHVLVVDDIVDNGGTLRCVQEMLESRGPASVRFCALTRKVKPRTVDVRIDYVGFEVPDRWVVGYGLDYAGRYRSLPYLACVSPAG